MAVVSGSLPKHSCYERPTGGWICSGGYQRGYGKTPTEAYNDWVYLIRYNSDGRNW